MTPHPGCTWDEILNEPNWVESRPHRPGYRDPYGRNAGSTRAADWFPEPAERLEALEKIRELEARAKRGELPNFREIVNEQKDKEVNLNLPGALFHWTDWILT